MKKFILAELKQGHEVADKIVEALEGVTKQKIAMVFDEKLVRKAGTPVKRINFALEEGQELGLTFRTDGDVVEIHLNKKKIPVVQPIDYDNEKGFIAAIEDLALKIKTGQEKFNIKRQSQKVKIPTTRAPSLTVKKRIQQARDALKELQEVNAKKRDDLAAKTAQLSQFKMMGGVGSA